MSFTNPFFLWLGAGLALLVVLAMWSHDRRRRRLAEFLGGNRAGHRLSGANLYRPRLERTLLLALAGLSLAGAAAEPHWEAPPTPPAPPAPLRSVVIAIDVSASMQARDVAPTRLGQAVLIARNAIKTYEKDRVGLLLFAGNTYVLAPPTHDHKALEFLLRGVTPNTASVDDPGTLMSLAIREATRLLDKKEKTPAERTIILIGDGEGAEPDTVIKAARAAARKGITIHTIGIGTSAGAPVVMPDGPYRNGGPVVDAKGAPVVSQYHDALLRRVAAVGGGRYTHGASRSRLRELQAGIAEKVESLSSPEQALPLWARIDLRFWLALAALICLLLESLLDVRMPAAMVRTASARRVA